MTDEYNDEIMRDIAAKVAKDLVESTSDMQQLMLLDVLEALKKGEDVDDGFINLILTRPFMERFIDELLKYEEE